MSERGRRRPVATDAEPTGTRRTGVPAARSDSPPDSPIHVYDPSEVRMLSVSDRHRGSRRFSLLSTRSSGSDSTAVRRPSIFPDEAGLVRPPRRVRPKPRLDETTLAAKREFAASGLVLVMRRKAAHRRRFQREMASADAAAAAVEAGGDMQVASAAIDMMAGDDDVAKAPQTQTNSYLISAIPHMPKSVAILCLIFNIFVPGLGTAISGMTVFCCGRSRMSGGGGKEDQHGETCCINLLVGIMQLFTTTFLLVGWAWSLVWGIYMIILAVERQAELKAEHDKALQAKALVALNSQIRAWTIVGQKRP